MAAITPTITRPERQNTSRQANCHPGTLLSVDAGTLAATVLAGSPTAFSARAQPRDGVSAASTTTAGPNAATGSFAMMASPKTTPANSGRPEAAQARLTTTSTRPSW